MDKLPTNRSASGPSVFKGREFSFFINGRSSLCVHVASYSVAFGLMVLFVFRVRER